MIKLIRSLNALIGVVLFLGGFIKLFGGFAQIEVNIFGVQFWYNNYTALPYILIVNIIGGGSLAYYSMSSVNFTYKKFTKIPSQALDSQTIGTLSKPLNKLQSITSVISLFLSMWLIFLAIMLTSTFVKAGSQFLIEIMFACTFFWLRALLPIAIFGINSSINNKIKKQIDAVKSTIRRQKIQMRKKEGLMTNTKR